MVKANSTLRALLANYHMYFVTLRFRYFSSHNILPVLHIAYCQCHTIIKTVQQIKSRIKEVKEDEYSNSLAKIQVCAMFLAGDIRRNVLLQFIRLCKETPCLCPSERHKDSDQKLTKTCVSEFAIKSLESSSEGS